MRCGRESASPPWIENLRAASATSCCIGTGWQLDSFLGWPTPQHSSSIECWIYKPGTDKQPGRRCNFFLPNFFTRLGKGCCWLKAFLYSPSIGIRWFSQLFVLSEPETLLRKLPIHLLKSCFVRRKRILFHERISVFSQRLVGLQLVSAIVLPRIRPLHC